MDVSQAVISSHELCSCLEGYKAGLLLRGNARAHSEQNWTARQNPKIDRTASQAQNGASQ